LHKKIELTVAQLTERKQ